MLTWSAPLIHVRAGSALLAVGEQLLVAGDDAYDVTWVDPVTRSEHTVTLVGDGGALEKLRKPDIEAAALAPDGVIWLFGSGSLSNRTALLRLVGETVTAYDGTALYAALAERLGCLPNIEGAVFLDDSLRLFHRATGRSPDVWVDVVAFSSESPRVIASGELRLGEIDGVPAHVTDATLLADGTIGFLCSAEETDDPVLDGAVSGSAVGVLDGDEAVWQRLVGPDGSPDRRKAEGLVMDPDGRGGYLVTDADDPERSAELCRFTLD